MKEWQFNILFLVGVGGAIFLILGPQFGLNSSPTALTGIGTILTYVLTQKRTITRKKKNKDEDEEDRPRRIRSAYDDPNKEGDDD